MTNDQTPTTLGLLPSSFVLAPCFVLSPLSFVLSPDFAILPFVILPFAILPFVISYFSSNSLWK